MERDREQAQREQVRREIDEKKEAMAEKLEEITDRVDEVRDRLRGVRQKLSLRHQVRAHPWLTLGLSMVAGYALFRVVHAGATERAVARAVEGTRDVARRARESGASIGEVIDGNALAQAAMDAIARAAMTTVGGMLLGALYKRLSWNSEDEEQEGAEVLYEQKVKSPTATAVKSGPILG